MARWTDYLTPKLTPTRVFVARVVAMLADAVQLLLFPLFIAGGVSPVNTTLDVVIAVVMIWLLGWHWALLPTAIAEVVPFVSLVPTWTLAVLLVTRKPSLTTS